MEMERGFRFMHHLTVIQWRRDDIGGVYFSPFFFGEIVYYTKCMNWGIHTLSDHLSIPHIGEKCMCEVSNNRMHCLYSNETNGTGHIERLIYITHIMRDFTHLPSHRDILAHT